MEEISTLARTRRIGGSLVVTIPAEVVREQNIIENEVVEVKVRKRRINGFEIKSKTLSCKSFCIPYNERRKL